MWNCRERGLWTGAGENICLLRRRELTLEADSLANGITSPGGKIKLTQSTDTILLFSCFRSLS